MKTLQDLTHRRVLTVALPVVLSNATVPILGAVDTGVVGQLGLAAPIGAVGIGAIALTAIYWIFGFLRMGTAGLTAQASGAGRKGEVSALLSRGMIIGLVAGFIIMALQVPLIWLALQTAPASSEVESLAQSYMGIRIYGAPAAIGIYVVTGWLIGLERTRGVLIVQLWMNGLNIVLDLWFVLGLGWGVEGVAIATLIAEWSGLLLGLWLCRDALKTPAWKDWPRVFERAQMILFARVNRDILLRSVMLQAIFLSFVFLGARFGDVTLAANHVLLQFLEITAFSMDGFAIAAETLVGQSMGVRSVARVRRAAVLTSFWGLITVLCTATAFALFGPWIIDVMTTSPEVRAEARVYLPYMVAAPLVGCAAWMLDGIFIGATRSADMRNMMALSAVIYVIALLILMPMVGNHGLWLALLISFIARGITLGWKYPALERAAG
ncbi:MATE family efflux transporter [Planktotalea sp.]|uniref:MATE family efflux transporter n=1 Tax=Planktotalea sp. TaxID=2029877 RepID=UPI0025EF35B3|nr:MATE family efflux transporter [Planktotalea sp.]